MSRFALSVLISEVVSYLIDLTWTGLAWHPIHETLFASGGSDGAVMFWLNGYVKRDLANVSDGWTNTEFNLDVLFCRVDKEVGSMEQAHDSIVWALAWHPLGHILCSGSNDHTW